MHKRDADPNTEQTNGSTTGSTAPAARHARPLNMWAIDWSTRPVEELQEGITAATIKRLQKDLGDQPTMSAFEDV